MDVRGVLVWTGCKGVLGWTGCKGCVIMDCGCKGGGLDVHVSVGLDGQVC